MSAKEILIGAGALGAVLGVGSVMVPPIVERAMQSAEERAAIEASVHYPGCNQVRAAGRAPLYAGQPGYREGMDGDHDGIACEDHSS
jgi:Excalibur calcium-binding domain